jgi:hypothetical protein
VTEVGTMHTEPSLPDIHKALRSTLTVEPTAIRIHPARWAEIRASVAWSRYYTFHDPRAATSLFGVQVEVTTDLDDPYSMEVVYRLPVAMVARP